MNEYYRRNFLIVLSAPSGGGKSTIKNKILKRSKNIIYSISYTTRKRRGDEKNGKDYFFVNKDKFLKMVENKEFLEFAEVHGNLYGTSRKFIEKNIQKGRHVIMDIDVQGANAIRKSNIDHVDIFILPPTPEILEKRLRKRGTDTDEVIDKRLINARNEVKDVYNYDYLVINDELDKAVSEVEIIIKAEENKVTRYKQIENIFYGGTNGS